MVTKCLLPFVAYMYISNIPIKIQKKKKYKEQEPHTCLHDS